MAGRLPFVLLTAARGCARGAIRTRMGGRFIARSLAFNGRERADGRNAHLRSPVLSLSPVLTGSPRTHLTLSAPMSPLPHRYSYSPLANPCLHWPLAMVPPTFSFSLRS